MDNKIITKKERIDYFDIAKGIGIILVVLGHLEYISLELRYAIVSFHMPLFFIISGMLFNITKEETRDIKLYIKAKAKRIMLPYLLFSIIYLIVIIALIFVAPDTYTWIYFFENAYFAVCLYGISVLWFLPALYFSSIIFVLIRKKTNHIMTVVIVLIATAVAYLCNYGLSVLNITLGKEFWFFHLNVFLIMILRSVISVFFLCAGYYFYQLFKKIQVSAFIDLVIGIFLMIPVVLLSQMNQAVDIHFLVFNIWYIYVFCACVGSFSIVFISRGLNGLIKSPLNTILKYYGENSLIIMATHMDLYVLYFSILVCNKIIDSSIVFPFCLLVVICVFIVEIVIIEIINRFFPIMVGKK